MGGFAIVDIETPKVKFIRKKAEFKKDLISLMENFLNNTGSKIISIELIHREVRTGQIIKGNRTSKVTRELESIELTTDMDSE